MRSAWRNRIIIQALGLVVVAAVIGVAYNSLSQLGVPLASSSTNAPPRAAELGHAVYANTAISMKLVPAGEPAPSSAEKVQPAAEPAAPPAVIASAGGIYSNETVAVNIVPLQPQAAVPAAASAELAAVVPEKVAPEKVVPGNAYRNETIAVKHVPAAGNPYRNETVAVKHVPAPAPQPAAAQDAAKPVAVTWPEVKKMIATGEAVLVDARPLVAFQAGSIPGAVSLPSNRIKDEIPEFIKKYATDKWLIVYCSDQGCASSEQVAATLLRDYGYQHVFHMPGGYAEWRIAETSQPKPKPEDKKQ